MLGEVKAPAPGQLGFKPKSNTTREAPFPLLYCALGEGASGLLQKVDRVLLGEVGPKTWPSRDGHWGRLQGSNQQGPQPARKPGDERDPTDQ